MSFLQKLGLVEEDEAKKVEPSTAPATPAPPANTTPPSSAPAAAPRNEIYERLVKKTAFKETPVGSVVEKYFAGLDGTPLTNEQKWGVAIAQATKLENVSKEGILGAFTVMAAWVGAERAKIDDTAKRVEEDEVVARDDRIKELKAQADELQAKLNAVVAEHHKLVEEQAEWEERISETKRQVDDAVERRLREIEDEKKFYASLLKG